MKFDFTAEQLDGMNIFGLRDLARRMGHHSPTNKKKQELLDFLMGLLQADASASVQSVEEAPKKRRGRPPKKNSVAETEIMEEVKTIKDEPTKEVDPALKVPFDHKSTVSPILEMHDTPTNNYVQGVIKESSSQRPNAKFDGKNRFDGRNRYENNRDLAHEEPVIEELEIREGVLEICPDGYGFLRANNYEQGDGDAYIAAPKIRKCGLRKGDLVKAYVKKLAENRPLNVQELISVNGDKPESAFTRPTFESLIPIYPDKRFKLELATSKNDFAIRAIDLVAPIGKGQRAMIVSPPKAGKTTLLKKIAASISANYPDAHLMVLLVDERPEEVTDMQRSIKGEVIYSTFDEMPEHHTKASEMVLERAKRLVERGRDVVILMDSLTRLARAYNLTITPTGKTLSGGIDPGSLYLPKRFFGAARNIENGGSLTIIATALVDTGSRMDDVIYEEFKGTGNMEIHLDRRLSEKRIFPAIDLAKSGTRREELLLSKEELECIFRVRRMLSVGDGQEATENLIQMMMKTQNNKEFIDMLNLQVAKLEKEGFTFTK